MQAFLPTPRIFFSAPSLRQLPRRSPQIRLYTTMSASISPSAASILLKGANPPIYLDVRTPTEFAAGHVPASMNIPVIMAPGQPVASFVEDVKKVVEMDDSLLVACKSGKRSTMAIGMLSEAGFSNLTEVEGGFDAWLEEGDLSVDKC